MDVRLRQVEEEDLPQLRDWRNADWLRPYVREYRLLNMTHQQNWFKSINYSRDVEMYGILVDGALVGVCGLTHINWVNRSAEVSIYLTPEVRRMGTASLALLLLERRAFDDFNLHRLWAEVFEFNEDGIRLFERNGYELEGTLREHVFKGGQYHNSRIYGRMRCNISKSLPRSGSTTAEIWNEQGP